MEKVGNILTYFKKELANSFDEREVSSWAYLSINYLLGFSKSDCILRANKKLTEATQNQFFQLLQAVKYHIFFQLQFDISILNNHVVKCSPLWINPR